ncbi:MAG: hypothetical protein ROR55_12730 [Devosia sp.]
MLPKLFPGVRVLQWKPTKKALAKTPAKAVAFIVQRLTHDGQDFVTQAEVMEHLGLSDKSNFRRTVRQNEQFQKAVQQSAIHETVMDDGKTKGWALMFKDESMSGEAA